MQPDCPDSPLFRRHPTSLNTTRLVRETFVARVEHHRVLGSTNDRAKQCAASQPGHLPLVIVADEQTAGRGRGSNRWWTGKGSLAFSLVLEGPAARIEHRHGPLMSLAAAAAVVQTVVPFLPGHAVGIHWPNDVYAAGRKLAGILVEVVPPALYVVGVGLNANNTMIEAPLGLQTRGTTIRDLTGRYCDPTGLLRGFLRHFAPLVEQLGNCPSRVGRLADTLCLQHGRRVCVQCGKRTVRGTCAGIAPNGALLVDTAEGRERLTSGILRR